MKITTFNPMILTKKPEDAIALFEALGFERHHHKSDETENEEQGLAFSTVRMKDANGFYLDISQPDHFPAPQDLTAIRMNVDNFGEAYELLTAHGFKNFYGDQTVDTNSSESAIMISPSGFVINLIQHIKD